MLIRCMDRTGRLAAARVAFLPTAIETAREAEAIIAKAEAARDVLYFEVENMTDEATALIDGFSLAPGGWPYLQELNITRMDIVLFLPHQIALQAPIYPALQALDLTGVPAPIDGPTFFAGLAQLPHLRRLVLWLILFKKWDTFPSTMRPLEFRLSHYTYAQKDVDDPDGTPAGWHIPIAAPSTPPKELSLLLRNAEGLDPLLAQPGCLDAVETLHLSDGSAWSTGTFLPLEAYRDIARGCPRLKELRVVGQAQSMCAGLATLLTDIRVPLRSVHLEFIFAPVPTRGALAEDDRAFSELLRESDSLRHLRSFALLTFWESHGLPDLEFPEIKARCRSRAVVFEHGAH